jgi:uncharacterized OB-fold protein
VTTVVGPVEGYDDAWFWNGVRAGQLLLRACATCHRRQHPPTPMCPACRGTEWSTAPALGTGRVYSWIASHHPNAADGDEARIVALVELDEGVRLVTNLQGIALDDVRAGLPVEVCFTTFDGGVVLPQFRPIEDLGR